MNNQDALLERYKWWSSLKHGGLLIAPSKLPGRLPEATPALSAWVSERLRRAVVRVLDGDDAAMPLLMDVVLQEILELPATEWTKGPGVEAKWSCRALTREVIKPRRVWQSRNGEVLPVFVADGSLGGKVARLGVGRGRRSVSRVVEWLRNAGQKVALLTNGRQWRLVHAGADYEAFCEWDIDLWFVEGSPGLQVDALRALLGRATLSLPAPDQPSPLIDAILASRKGQAELSGVLGERVRMAVEHLIKVSSASIVELETADLTLSMRDYYVAASRMVMRCIVVLFAEARDLLPRDNEVYDGSYGLQALRAQLDRAAGGRGADRLRHSHSAWPRLMSLFRLVHAGSAHEAIPIPAYAGKLFEPSDVASSDAVLRALHAFERRENNPSDAAVHRILELLTRSRVKVRQGRGSTWVEAPVDFSDLSSEYIGILYEGLLDFELRQAPDDDAVVFLNIGAEPALPFSHLDGMTVSERKGLLDKLKTSAKKSAMEEGGDEDDADDEDESEPSEGTEDGETEESESDVDSEPVQDEEPVSVTELEADNDVRRYFSEAVDIWARNAVRDAGWCKRGADFSDPQVVSQAKGLIRRIILPGEFFLVRWGGTRKGSGTFYTRPQLAGPTTRRTLRPLAYRPTKEKTEEETGLVDVLEWEPKKPEEILELKVCDPAMGSGSFLVSALRFLVDALVESLHLHLRLDSNEQRTICKLADGFPVEHPSQETLPVPVDHPDFEERLRSRLRRHVVERCLYGVDLDPLAVELGQMALWVETMDRSLPFSFLDHKLKVGNSLVGCWLDRYEDYPVMAWEREGGDAKHERFVHHKRTHVFDRGAKKGRTEERGDVWTDAIKQKKALVKSDMADMLSGQRRLGAKVPEARAVHARAQEVFEVLHGLPVHEVQQRADAYRALQEDEQFQALKAAFDAWCALWFWPGDKLDFAPMPLGFPWDSVETRGTVADIAAKQRFFHWELEFPDVFTPTRSGFEAVIGNPPWEIQKPNSKEFFSNVDPLYRTYGKQEALARQHELFESDTEVEEEWLSYSAAHKAMSNWVKHVGSPFGDSDGGSFSFVRSGNQNTHLHTVWGRLRAGRKGYADREHPFRHQGSADLNTYKMFLELSYSCLQEEGRMALVVPGSLYGDSGSSSLRKLFLEKSALEYLYAFQNEKRVFEAVHHAFKICIFFVSKGLGTRVFQAMYSLGIAGSPAPHQVEEQISTGDGALALSAEQARRFSPDSHSFIEIRSKEDLAIVERLYSAGPLLGDTNEAGWLVKYSAEFHMTNDSSLFPPRTTWEGRGYLPDEYGHWVKGDWKKVRERTTTEGQGDIGGSMAADGVSRPPRGMVYGRDRSLAMTVESIVDVALPLYEGRSVGQYDFQRKAWVSGKGRRAVWRQMEWQEKQLAPQFLMSRETYLQRSPRTGSYKLALMDVAASNVERTAIGTPLRGLPCGNSAPTLVTRDGDLLWTLGLAACFNSFAYDFFARQRCTGLHMNWFIIAETPLPQPGDWALHPSFVKATMQLSFPHVRFATEWCDLLRRCPAIGTVPWPRLFALSVAERTRTRAIVEAVVAHVYGLGIGDFEHILSDTAHPRASLQQREYASKIDSKRFWLLDRDRLPEHRTSVLSLVAFHELKRIGLEAFLAQNDGEGWMLPETLRLADYGLGHDNRARVAQPVASVLGPRFYDWQLEQDVEESWEECRRHAELIRSILSLPEDSARADEPEPLSAQKKATPKDLFGKPVATDLFGKPIATKPRRR